MDAGHLTIVRDSVQNAKRPAYDADKNDIFFSKNDCGVISSNLSKLVFKKNPGENQLTRLLLWSTHVGSRVALINP